MITRSIFVWTVIKVVLVNGHSSEFVATVLIQPSHRQAQVLIAKQAFRIGCPFHSYYLLVEICSDQSAVRYLDVSLGQ